MLSLCFLLGLGSLGAKAKLFDDGERAHFYDIEILCGVGLALYSPPMIQYDIVRERCPLNKKTISSRDLDFGPTDEVNAKGVLLWELRRPACIHLTVENKYKNAAGEVKIARDVDLNVFLPSGYRTDFASIPSSARGFMNPADYPFASLIHDFLYDLGIDGRRKRADEVFIVALRSSPTPDWKADAMYLAVRSAGAGGYAPHRNGDLSEGVYGLKIPSRSVIYSFHRQMSEQELPEISAHELSDNRVFERVTDFREHYEHRGAIVTAVVAMEKKLRTAVDEDRKLQKDAGVEFLPTSVFTYSIFQKEFGFDQAETEINKIFDQTLRSYGLDTEGDKEKNYHLKKFKELYELCPRAITVFDHPYWSFLLNRAPEIDRAYVPQ